MLIEDINSPSDLKALSINELNVLCLEIRDFLIQTIINTGGHLGGALGVVELSIAIHFVFNSPKDRIIWDIGHQSHVHKILTNRKNLIKLLRKKDGMSTFCSIKESEHDIFGAGHSSTSISAGIGFLQSDKILNKNNWVISIIGDGAISGGMAFEGLNNIPKNGKMIVVLNDNDMSIDPTVGNLSEYFKNKLHQKNVNNIDDIKSCLELENENFFSDFSLSYIGVADGHNLSFLIEIFDWIFKNVSKPVLLHIKTKKGFGYLEADSLCDKSHAIDKENLVNNQKTYSSIATEHLYDIFKKDKKICAITPAMIKGSCLSKIREDFKERVFDVSIAEQHAITFAGGLALSGIIPFCFIYSTFLQRGYDQLIHDIAIQSAPVRFLIDRAGFVGGDGVTHHGSFDISMLIKLPNFILMAPSSGVEFIEMINTALLINDKPSAIRYPRKCILENYDINTDKSIEIGKGEIVLNGKNIAILSYGTMLEEVMLAVEILHNYNIKPTVFNLKFAKPIDKDAIINISKSHDFIVTIEDGCFGGVGDCISRILSDVFYAGKFKSLCHSMDFFVYHGSQEEQYKASSIDANSIVNLCLSHGTEI